MDLEPSSDRPREFLDAERIFRTLQAVEMARDLYVSAAEKFPVAPGEEALNLDRAAFSYLASEAFVEVPYELQANIERYRGMDASTGRIRESLKDVYMRLKLTRGRLERASDDKGAGLFGGAKKRWEVRSRQDQFEKEIEEIQLQRQRLEGELERASNTLRDLLDQVHHDPALRRARWFHERPVVITHFGEFLLDYLGDMNQANFRGRSLAEIIEIGPALA